MSMHTSPLDYVKVAAPCSADWERMTGTNQVRYCDQCSLHVYNLSGMKRGEAESLVASTEGRLCVRFYRRADGTILTNNCPVGLGALKRRLSRLATATFSAVFSFLAGVGSHAALSADDSFDAVQGMTVIATSAAEVKTQPPNETEKTNDTLPDYLEIMGAIIVPPTLRK